MAKVNLHIASLVGPGETPAERTTLTVAPAYAFVDGTAINWPVPVTVNLTDGEGLISGMETEYLGEPLVWAFRLSFENGRGGVIGSYSATKTFPVGASGTVEYADMVDVDVISIPGYGPTWAEQARLDAVAAEASRVAAEAAQAAAEAVPLANDTIIAGRVNTVGSATDLALKASYVTYPKPERNGLTGWYHADGYGIVGDTTTNNTALIQALVNAVLAAGGGRIHFPKIPGTSGVYRFDQLVINAQGNANLTISGSEGVVLRAAPLLTTDFIIIQSGSTSTTDGTFIRRVTLRDLNIQGQVDYASGTKVDRRGVVIHQAQDLTFENVKIAQFKKGALVLDDCFDSYFRDIEIKWSGYGLDNANYAHALQLNGTYDNSNNNRFTNLHMEFCPLEIFFEHNSRQNFFTTFKLENGGGTEQNTSSISPIWDKGGIENTFSSGMLVQGQSSNVPRIRADQNTDAYLTTFNVKQVLKFVACLFFANSLSKARWFAGYNTSFTDVTAQRANGAAGGYAFDFFSRCSFKGGSISMADVASNVFRLQGDNNVIDAPTLYAGIGGDGSGTAVTTLSSGATNNLVQDPVQVGAFASDLALGAAFTTAGSTGSNQFTSQRDAQLSKVGGGAINAFHRRVVKLTDATAATYTTLLNGSNGQQVSLLATTANVSLTHGNTANATFLKAGTTIGGVVALANNQMVNLVNVDGVWREV